MQHAAKPFGRSTSIVFTEAARALATAPMPASSGQVLWWCIGNLHSQYWTIVKHESIALQIGLTRSAVTKSLRTLIARGIVQSGQNSRLRLTIFLGWQGTAREYKNAMTGRTSEIELARAWAKSHGHAEGENERFWRLAEIDVKEKYIPDQSRIVINPEVCGGRPIIAGTRMPVADVLGILAGGAGEAEILADFPYLTAEDIRACLAYAVEAVDHGIISPAK